jgi:hypothetical protein
MMALWFGMVEDLNVFSGWRRRWCAAGVMLVLLGGLTAPEAEGVLFEASGDPGLNTTAPTGVYESAGWQHLGYYGSYLGTAIAPQYFITSQHFGFQGTTFVQDALFTGGATVSQTVDMTANGGLGYWDIAGSDLRVYKIEGMFASHAEIYLGAGIGEEAVLTGRGGARGEAVTGGTGPGTKGWEHTMADGVARWGTNVISGTTGSGAGVLWVAKFDGGGGTTFEAGLSEGDSGGGLFVLDGGVWKLAGVNYSVDGLFDTNNATGDGSEFSASMTDMRGFYTGSDGGGWTQVPNLPEAAPSSLYFSSVSANAAAIQAIIAVPEPGSALLVTGVLAGWVARRRRE